MPGWAKFLSRVTHMAFYALLLILPLSGWTFSSAGPTPLNWIVLIDLPTFGFTKDAASTGIAYQNHTLLAYLLLCIRKRIVSGNRVFLRVYFGALLLLNN